MRCTHPRGFPGGASGKEYTCQCRRHKRHGSIPELGRSPRGGYVFLPEESHGQRILVGYTVHGVAKSLIQLKRLSTQHTPIQRSARCPLTAGRMTISKDLTHNKCCRGRWRRGRRRWGGGVTSYTVVWNLIWYRHYADQWTGFLPKKKKK